MKRSKLYLFGILMIILLFSQSGCENSPEGGNTQGTIYTLTTVTSPAGSGVIYLTPGGGSYQSGTTVTLEPSPDAEWVFSKWEGDLTGNANPAALVMDGNKTITAVFVKKKYDLTINVSGAGHVTETAKTLYDSGATVSLMAIPDPGWNFDHWEGALAGVNNPQDIVMDSDKQVTAVFLEKPAAKWNFLVYLDGDNSLEGCGLYNINQMEQIGSTDEVNILVLLDQYSSGTKLYLVTKDTNTSAISSQVLADYGELDMSNPETLKNFIVYCQQSYPASHTILTLWDHGGGVWPRNYQSQIGTRGIGIKGICWDEHSSTGFPWNCLTTDQVATTLADARAITGQKIDIINTDACLMQMLEVAYQWRDQAAYLTGSEANVPGDGDPYNLILSHLITNSEMAPQELASTLVDDYSAYYNFGLPTTYSAIDLSQVCSFISTFQVFATALNNVADGSMQYISNSRVSYSNFGYTQGGATYYAEYIDLGDFCHKIKTNVKNEPVLNTAAGGLETAITNLVMHHCETGGYTTNTCCGVSINLPWNTDIWNLYSGANRYGRLDLARDTDWDEFILKNVTWSDSNPGFTSKRIR